MLDRSTLKDALKTTSDCLAPQQLEKLAEDSSLKNTHLEQCPRCQTELALLKSFESNEPLPGEGAALAWISKRIEQRLDQIKGGRAPAEATASTRAGSWFSRWFGGKAGWLVPVSAALVLVIVVTSIALMHRSQEPQLRADAGKGPVIYRSQEIEVIGPVGEVKEAPKALQWKSFPGAAHYKFSIMEVDGVPLWSGENVDQTVTIPPAVRAKLLPGKSVLWQVSALDLQGRVLAASQVQRFFVQLKSSGTISSKIDQRGTFALIRAKSAGK
jgi:hypothetical protein